MWSRVTSLGIPNYIAAEHKTKRHLSALSCRHATGQFKQHMNTAKAQQQKYKFDYARPAGIHRRQHAAPRD